MVLNLTLPLEVLVLATLISVVLDPVVVPPATIVVPTVVVVLVVPVPISVATSPISVVVVSVTSITSVVLRHTTTESFQQVPKGIALSKLLHHQEEHLSLRVVHGHGTKISASKHLVPLEVLLLLQPLSLEELVSDLSGLGEFDVGRLDK